MDTEDIKDLVGEIIVGCIGVILAEILKR